MFDYTKTAVNKIWTDFKKFFYICNIVTQIVYLTYLAYALIAQTGNPWVNGILLALSLAYFVFFLVMTTGEKTKEKKRGKKIGDRIFKYLKQLIALYNLAVIVYGFYGVYTASSHVTIASLIQLVQIVFMTIGWVLGLVFNVVELIVESRVHFLLEGLEADYQELTKPVKTVGNFFKKVTGQEIEPEKEKSKSRLWLDEKVKAGREAKKQAKAEKKARKTQPAEAETAITQEKKPRRWLCKRKDK